MTLALTLVLGKIARSMNIESVSRLKASRLPLVALYRERGPQLSSTVNPLRYRTMGQSFYLYEETPCKGDAGQMEVQC